MNSRWRFSKCSFSWKRSFGNKIGVDTSKNGSGVGSLIDLPAVQIRFPPYEWGQRFLFSRSWSSSQYGGLPGIICSGYNQKEINRIETSTMNRVRDNIFPIERRREEVGRIAAEMR